MSVMPPPCLCFLSVRMVYGLSTSLYSSNIGGHIGGHLLNNLCYTDDMCLVSLSSAGMQCLVNICNDYAEQHI